MLQLVVTNHIFNTYPDLPEGELAKVRASVVSSAALAEVAAVLDLGAGLLLGKGEDQSGGREKPSILADAMEAVIGAVYLDGGWEAADDFVMRLLGERISEAAAGPGGQDFKTRLQELAARSFDELPRYDVLDDGPDHAKRFFATVTVAGLVRGRGEGRSKKQAEQAAARLAWQELAALADVAEAAGAADVVDVPDGADMADAGPDGDADGDGDAATDAAETADAAEAGA
ncbi:MAG: ribonuclease [Acidimicrobiaceae bacterium]|nr:ribonuclease [Acidimicrobiaceae bacterium]